MRKVGAAIHIWGLGPRTRIRCKWLWAELAGSTPITKLLCRRGPMAESNLPCRLSVLIQTHTCLTVLNNGVSSDPTSLGIIAGSKSLPLMLARLARASGVQRLVAVAFKGETDPNL